jgi:RNA polymerase sigma-70 factor, ECF subfamily
MRNPSDVRSEAPALVAAVGNARELRATLEERVAALFDELQEPVYRYLRFVGMHPQDAEEIVQETFLRLFRHLEAGRPDGNLRGWLFRVAHNLAFNERRASRFVARPTPESWDVILTARPDPAPNPEQALLEGERQRRLQQAVALLPPRQRQCLALRAEGFVYREIGDVLGVTTSTVAEAIHRGLTTLSGGFHE